MKPDDLFQDSLELIDRVIGFVCRRARVFGADAEDFGSQARLALIEDDYAVLRKYEGRSSLSTYLTVVIERLFVDETTRSRGRWHPSAEALRQGSAGVLLETLVRRDGLSIDEALPHVRALDPTLTHADLVETVQRFPERIGRPRLVDVDEMADTLAGREEADTRAMRGELAHLSRRAGRAFREALDRLPLEDRMLIRFRFVSAMSIADIARMMRLPQRPLYRRLEALLRQFRSVLAEAGIDDRVAAELVETGAEEIDFGLEERKNGLARPSTPTAVNSSEEET